MQTTHRAETNQKKRFFSCCPIVLKLCSLGVPAVGGLKFSMAQKNFAKSAVGEQKYGESPV